MRSKVAKELRRLSESDCEGLPYIKYVEVQANISNPQKVAQGVSRTIRVMDRECQRKYYKLMKKLYKYLEKHGF